MNNKKIIITGGLGFIGSNLVERLIADNKVTIIDNQSTGKPNNIKHLKQDNIHITYFPQVDFENKSFS